MFSQGHETKQSQNKPITLDHTTLFPNPLRQLSNKSLNCTNFELKISLKIELES